MLPLAFGCLVAAAFQVGSHPREVPVISLDGLPGVLGVLSATLPQRPVALPSLPATRLDDRDPASQLDAPHGLSLTFARPLPVRDVLLLLFRGTPFSVILDPAASANFVGELKDLTLRQALESVLTPARLDYDVESTIVRVFPRQAETRLFRLDHLSAPRGGMDYFAETGAGVQSILSSSGRVHVNRKAALMQVTDFSDRLDLVASYLEAAHLRVTRQVRIESRVFEVTRADATPLDWAALANRPGSGVRAAVDAAGWRVDDFAAWLRTLAEMGSVRQIAAPVLLAMNNEPASLRVEDSAVSELKLTVTPQIAADGVIHMQIAPTYIDRRKLPTPTGDAREPFMATVDTVVRLASGETALIGGLMRQTDASTRAEVVIVLTANTVAPTMLRRAGDR